MGIFKLLRLSPIFVFLLFAVLAGAPSIVAQQAAKTLTWGERANHNCRQHGSAVKGDLQLEDILANGRSVLVGEPFEVDVRDLVFVVKNISEQPIGFIQITVVLTDVKKQVQVPFVSSHESQPLRPGEQAELRVPSGKVYDWVNEAVTSQGIELASVRQAAIEEFVVDKEGKAIAVCATARDSRNKPPSR